LKVQHLGALNHRLLLFFPLQDDQILQDVCEVRREELLREAKLFD
jgi:hypothetical protein